MKYQRVFNFIYFGFIDNELMSKNPITNIDKLNKSLKMLEVDFERQGELYKHAAFMSVDLFYRYIFEYIKNYKEVKPCGVPIDYMRLVAPEKNRNIELNLPQSNISSDIECIGFIHEQYIKKYMICERGRLNSTSKDPNNTKHEMDQGAHDYINFKEILSDSDRLHITSDKYSDFYTALEMYIRFFEHEIERGSLNVTDDLNHQDLNLYNRIMAINLIEKASSFNDIYLEEVGMNVKVKDLTKFFCHVVAGSLLTSNLLPALQAFIDLLLFPVLFKNEEPLNSRKKYIEWVIDETKVANQKIGTLRYEKRIKTLANNHGEQFTNYIAKNICTQLNGKSWFRKMQDCAIKSGQHYDFVITALSLLSVKTDIRMVLNKATSCMSTKKHRDATYDSKDMVKLNIDLNADLKETIKAICKKEEFHIREFVTDAILNELKKNYPDELNTYLNSGKVTRRPSSASASRRTSRYTTENTAHEVASGVELGATDQERLSRVNEYEASAAPFEEHQSHQPPSEQRTSVELPTSDVVENEDKRVDKPNPKSDISAALRELNKNLG